MFHYPRFLFYGPFFQIYCKQFKTEPKLQKRNYEKGTIRLPCFYKRRGLSLLGAMRFLGIIRQLTLATKSSQTTYMLYEFLHMTFKVFEDSVYRCEIKPLQSLRFLQVYDGSSMMRQRIVTTYTKTLYLILSSLGKGADILFFTQQISNERMQGK